MMHCQCQCTVTGTKLHQLHSNGRERVFVVSLLSDSGFETQLATRRRGIRHHLYNTLAVSTDRVRILVCSYSIMHVCHSRHELHVCACTHVHARARDSCTCEIEYNSLFFHIPVPVMEGVPVMPLYRMKATASHHVCTRATCDFRVKPTTT